MKISYSRVASYLSCPYKHFLGYEKGLQSNKPSRPLTFGSDFHKLLELRGQPEKLAEAKKEIGERFYEMRPEWQSELGDNYILDLAIIFEDYMDIYKDEPLPKITEQEFEIKLGTLNGEPLIVVGVIDELYKFRDRDTHEKYLKVGEHKTFSTKPNHNFLVMNTQKCIYAKACQILYGMYPRTVIWDFIHSRPAEQPVWLEKSSRFSSAKSTKITPYSWIRACAEHNITDPKILAQKADYACNVSNFFFRCELDFQPSMVENIWDGFVYTSKQIIKQGHKNRAKNITRDCSWCSYCDICYAELTQGDVQSIIDRDFEIVERDDVVTERRMD